MAIIKCKMCGGDMELTADQRCGICEYCGSTMTLPKVDDEQRAAAFNRGNHFRRIGEFDKALTVYERIVQEDDSDAEAHWCCALCRFGIEYVKDPASGEYLPTCHRASYDSFLDDVDYKAAIQHADVVARRQYEQDGEKIAQVQRGILSVSQKEQPFDVFICYKECDEQGNRTVDSTLAQDIYYHLADQGFRVFFSRITLEDKGGEAYEPYIFAALHSAKVMIVVGTKPEHLNAVWVKNEWSRYLSIVKNDRKKLLIPCYRDMDPYDMPEQLSVLQSYDMSKIGFIQDLIRGISKVLDADKKPETKETVVVQSEGGTNFNALLKRGYMALEDQSWQKAEEFFEQVLNMNAECAEAYLGLFCVERKYRSAEQIAVNPSSLSDSPNKEKALRFASPTLLAELESWLDAVVQLVEGQQRQEAEQRRQSKLRCEAFRPVRPLLQSLLCAGCGDEYHVGLRSDGTVIATGDNQYGQCNVSKWRDIVAIFARANHTVGLRSDGTVVATGNNQNGQCNVSEWWDIVDIYVGAGRTVGLRSDGTVVATGDDQCGRCNVLEWRDIIAIFSSGWHTVGLQSDGTVVATGDNSYGQCNVSEWRDIVAIRITYATTVGLRSDGTVVATGDNSYGQRNVSKWQDITTICVSIFHTVGLRSDGTVVATGDNRYGQCNVSKWRDIVAIFAESNCTVGLRSDGTVVATGDNKYGQCNVSKWRLFSSAEELVEQHAALCQQGEKLRQAEAHRRAEEERQHQQEQRRQEQAELRQKQARLQSELANLKGFFSGKRRREIEARLAQIDMELRKYM